MARFIHGVLVGAFLTIVAFLLLAGFGVVSFAGEGFVRSGSSFRGVTEVAVPGRGNAVEGYVYSGSWRQWFASVNDAPKGWRRETLIPSNVRYNLYNVQEDTYLMSSYPPWVTDGSSSWTPTYSPSGIVPSMSGVWGHDNDRVSNGSVYVDHYRVQLSRDGGRTWVYSNDLPGNMPNLLSVGGRMIAYNTPGQTGALFTSTGGSSLPYSLVTYESLYTNAWVYAAGAYFVMANDISSAPTFPVFRASAPGANIIATQYVTLTGAPTNASYLFFSGLSHPDTRIPAGTPIIAYTQSANPTTHPLYWVRPSTSTYLTAERITALPPDFTFMSLEPVTYSLRTRRYYFQGTRPSTGARALASIDYATKTWVVTSMPAALRTVPQYPVYFKGRIYVTEAVTDPLWYSFQEHE